LQAAGAAHVAGRGMVLTGGASQLDGAAEVAGRILDKQVRIGRPIHVHGLAESTGGPGFAACAGTLIYAASPMAEHDVGAVGGADKGGSALVRMGRWLRENL
jgi:cell division protein FtsA